MPTKKDRLKKQRIQEQQKLAKEATSANEATLLRQKKGLEDGLTALQKKYYDLLSQDRASRTGVAIMRRKVSELEKKLAHQEKLTVDMHNTHVEMRLSLRTIADLHRKQPNGHCAVCVKPWPCETYAAVRLPMQTIVTSLLILEQELSNDEAREAPLSSAARAGEGDASETR